MKTSSPLKMPVMIVALRTWGLMVLATNHVALQSLVGSRFLRSRIGAPCLTIKLWGGMPGSCWELYSCSYNRYTVCSCNKMTSIDLGGHLWLSYDLPWATKRSFPNFKFFRPNTVPVTEWPLLWFVKGYTKVLLLSQERKAKINLQAAKNSCSCNRMTFIMTLNEFEGRFWPSYDLPWARGHMLNLRPLGPMVWPCIEDRQTDFRIYLYEFNSW